MKAIRNITESNSLVGTREFGSTGLRISEIGFGCGGYWGLPVFSENDAARLINQAIDQGITFFDTGHNYSGGNAELRLGRILNRTAKSGLLIGTKVGTRMVSRYRVVKDFSREYMESSVQDSLRNLQMDSIPLLQLHSPSECHLNDDTLETLNKLKASGVVRFVGLSASGRTAELAISLRFFDCIMLTYNVLHRDMRPLMDSAARQGMGILVKSPLAHGLYSSDFLKISGLSDIWYFLRVLKNDRRDIWRGRRYQFINRIPGWQGYEIALAYVLGNELVDCAVIGTTDIAHLDQNIQASHRKLPQPISDLIESA